MTQRKTRVWGEESKHVTWDDVAKNHRVHLTVSKHQVHLGRFQEESEARVIADAALFLLGRPRTEPEVLPSKQAITKVRVKLAALHRSRTRSNVTRG